MVICPTTEADLADGLPAAAPTRTLPVPGCPSAVTSTWWSTRSRRPAGWSTASGWPVAIAACSRRRRCGRPRWNSHAAIGSPGGVLAVGAPADLVAIRTDSARTAGADLEQLVMCASAQDVDVVVVGGLVRVRSGNHVTYGDPGPLLAARDRTGLEVSDAAA